MKSEVTILLFVAGTNVFLRSAPKARILVIDGQVMVRQGLSQIINLQSDLEVCGESSTFQTGLTAAQKLKPDVILVEITLGNGSGQGNGLEMIKSLIAQRPSLPVLVVTMHEESLYAELAMRSGAMGYIMKTEPAERLLAAIRRVLQGKLYLSDNIVFKMIRHQAGLARKSQASMPQVLSDRELQVFQMIGQWRGTRDIARELHLSIKTIEYYRAKIKEKLGLQKGRDLMRVATERAVAADPGAACNDGAPVSTPVAEPSSVSIFASTD